MVSVWVLHGDDHKGEVMWMIIGKRSCNGFEG